MTDRPENPPAFPNDGGGCMRDDPKLGMSLRAYIATAALQGILAGGWSESDPHDNIAVDREAASLAVDYADALLFALAARGRT